MWPRFVSGSATPAYVYTAPINVTLSLSPALELLLAGGNRELLAAITKLGLTMTQKMDEYKVQFAAFATKLDAFIAAANTNQTNSDALVAEAVQKERDGEDVDIADLSAALAAEADKVPSPPTLPTPPAPPPVDGV